MLSDLVEMDFRSKWFKSKLISNFFVSIIAMSARHTEIRNLTRWKPFYPTTFTFSLFETMKVREAKVIVPSNIEGSLI